MNPDELRAHADRIADRYNIQDGDAALWRSVVHVVQAARNLADVIDGEWPEHWARCNPRLFTSKSSAYAAGYRAAREDAHAVASGTLRIAHGETNEEGKR